MSDEKKMPLDKLPIDTLKHSITPYLDYSALSSCSRSGSSILFATTRPSLSVLRQEAADKLHGHINHWRYNDIKTLVNTDPEVLFIKRSYKPNRFLSDEQCQSERLSPLEFAWLMGDENLINLFEDVIREKLGEKVLKDTDRTTRKVDLELRSMEYREQLSKVLRALANDSECEGLDITDQRALCYKAPQWIYGLANYFFYNAVDLDNAIELESKVSSVDIFSEEVRMAIGGRVGRRHMREEGPTPKLLAFLSMASGAAMHSLAAIIAPRYDETALTQYPT